MSKVYRKYKDYHKTENGIEYKKCQDCMEWFELNLINFGSDKSSKDKHNVRCKTCQKVYQDAYYELNKVHIKKKSLQWQRDNYEFWKTLVAKQDAKPDKKQRKRDISKRQREDGYIAQYRRDNPEQMRGYSSEHRIHDITTKERNSLLEVFDYSCAYCDMTIKEHKIKYNERLHDDHVDHEGYNDLRNDVPACKGCNSSKWQFDMETWFREQEFFTEEKLEFVKLWITEGYKDYIEYKPPYRIFRKQNEDKRTYHHELWTVDEKRNEIECIAVGDKKKDLDIHIKEYSKSL